MQFDSARKMLVIVHPHYAIYDGHGINGADPHRMQWTGLRSAQKLLAVNPEIERVLGEMEAKNRMYKRQIDNARKEGASVTILLDNVRDRVGENNLLMQKGASPDGAEKIRKHYISLQQRLVRYAKSKLRNRAISTDEWPHKIGELLRGRGVNANDRIEVFGEEWEVCVDLVHKSCIRAGFSNAVKVASKSTPGRRNVSR